MHKFSLLSFASGHGDYIGKTLESKLFSGFDCKKNPPVFFPYSFRACLYCMVATLHNNFIIHKIDLALSTLPIKKEYFSLQVLVFLRLRDISYSKVCNNFYHSKF